MRKCRIRAIPMQQCQNLPRGSRLSPTLEPVPLLWLGSVNARTASETVQHRQIVLSHLRGELELQAFDRDHLKGFDTKNTQKQFDYVYRRLRFVSQYLSYIGGHVRPSKNVHDEQTSSQSLLGPMEATSAMLLRH
jgi:hypothetical protein